MHSTYLILEWNLNFLVGSKGTPCFKSWFKKKVLKEKVQSHIKEEMQDWNQIFM